MSLKRTLQRELTCAMGIPRNHPTTDRARRLVADGIASQSWKSYECSVVL